MRVFFLLFVFLVQAPAETCRVLAPDFERYHQLKEVREQRNGSDITELLELYRDHTLLPPNSIVHVVGPAINFYEWMIPLLARADLKVVVSEHAGGPHELVRRQIQDKQIFEEKVWKPLVAFNPQLLKYFSAQGSAAAFLEVQNRVLFQLDAFHPSVGKADLVFARMPHEPERLMTLVKPGGVVWMITELVDRERLKASFVINLPAPWGEFFPSGTMIPSPDVHSRGTTLGMMQEGNASMWVIP